MEMDTDLSLSVSATQTLLPIDLESTWIEKVFSLMRVKQIGRRRHMVNGVGMINGDSGQHGLVV